MDPLGRLLPAHVRPFEGRPCLGQDIGRTSALQLLNLRLGQTRRWEVLTGREALEESFGLQEVPHGGEW